jgi:2-oxoglutarate dehydrogenase E2 component (dihydrolipoamide succinyltransferase)
VKIGQVVAMIDTADVEESQISDLKSQISTPAPPASNLRPPAFTAAEAKPKAQTIEPAAKATAARAAESQISNFKSQIKAPVPAGERQTRRKLTPLRQRIAERLVAAQHEAAMLTTFNEVDMSAIMAIRAKYQDDFVKKNGLKLGFMSFFVKAVVHALKEVPAVNAQLDGDTLVENHFYDIGVAVSTERGLMVPVIRDCSSLGMAAIEKAIAEVAAKARDGKIALTDLEGGVFTITNGGIFGSLLSTPIINPPQSAILGMHTIQERPVAINGQVVIRPMMYVALSYDHRIVDGREAVTFLVKVKQSLEDPARLLLSV